MLAPLMKTLAQAGVYYGISQFLFQGRRAELRVKDILFAVAIIFLAVLVGFWGILGVVLALFFQLADLFAYVQPALIAGGVLLAIAIGLFWQGQQFIRRSRRP